MGNYASLMKSSRKRESLKPTKNNLARSLVSASCRKPASEIQQVADGDDLIEVLLGARGVSGLSG